MMDNTTLLAEKILISAASSNDGSCYPSQVNTNVSELDAAMKLLEMYGRTRPSLNGAMPIFTINEMGKYFASTGAWSGKEKAERIVQERHQEEMEAMRRNNKLVKWSIIVTIVIGLATILVSIL